VCFACCKTRGARCARPLDDGVGRRILAQAGASSPGTPATRSDALGAPERRFVAASHLDLSRGACVL